MAVLSFLFLIEISLLMNAVVSLAGSRGSGIIRKIVVAGGTHGNEYTGVWCTKALQEQKEQLQRDYPSLTISTLLANKEAFLQNKRFIDVDLNRQFTRQVLVEGKSSQTTVEGKRALELDQLLGPKFDDNDELNNNAPPDILIDLHSTTANMGLTLIIAEGDTLMAEAAAYVLSKCQTTRAQILMHTHTNRNERPNFSSLGRHGFTIEVGPVPQGVLRHDAVEQTQHALYSFLEFLEKRNNARQGDSKDSSEELMSIYKNGKVPCYRSAPAVEPGEMSGKITWPSDKENPNFPTVLIHKTWQDEDFRRPIKKGDPLFVNLDGSTIPYSGSHGSPVHLMFINEGGYYYSQSGTGIGVALRTWYDLKSGKLLSAANSKEKQSVLDDKEL